MCIFIVYPVSEKKRVRDETRVYHVPLSLKCIYGGCDKGENGDGKERRGWRLLALLYANDSVLCGESEEYLRAMVLRFNEGYRRRGLKVNAGKEQSDGTE